MVKAVTTYSVQRLKSQPRVRRLPEPRAKILLRRMIDRSDLLAQGITEEVFYLLVAMESQDFEQLCVFDAANEDDEDSHDCEQDMSDYEPDQGSGTDGAPVSGLTLAGDDPGLLQEDYGVSPVKIGACCNS